MKTHEFGASNNIGKWGEGVIKAFLMSRSDIRRYQDVSDVESYQRMDIDGIIHLPSGHRQKIEIKTDTYTTGNIFFETESCVEYNTPGCMYKTKADFLYYYLPGYDKVYVLQMDKYRIWFKLHKHMFKYHTFINKKKSGDTHSGGYAIPIEYLEKHFSLKYWKVYEVDASFKTSVA